MIDIPSCARVVCPLAFPAARLLSGELEGRTLGTAAYAVAAVRGSADMTPYQLVDNRVWKLHSHAYVSFEIRHTLALTDAGVVQLSRIATGM